MVDAHSEVISSKERRLNLLVGFVLTVLSAPSTPSCANVWSKVLPTKSVSPPSMKLVPPNHLISLVNSFQWLQLLHALCLKLVNVPMNPLNSVGWNQKKLVPVVLTNIALK